MLNINSVLNPQQCRECKGCCFFDKDDAWEVSQLVELKENKQNKNEFICAHLGSNGCELCENKPLECELYPFRIMKLGGNICISLCGYCTAVTDLPLSRIIMFVEDNTDEFVKLAETHTEIIKPYNDRYVILKVI